MQFPHFTHPVTGVVVPVSSLKSRDSVGIGEFADLVPFGRWAVGNGLEMIQILPVNDTAYERSPYSALSAFALHPIFGRLQDFPEAGTVDGISRDIEDLASRLPSGNRVDFAATLGGKLEILKKMWQGAPASVLKEADAWGAGNPWVRNYALFSLLREGEQLRAWADWRAHRDPSQKDLEKLWKKHRRAAGFWVWLQWRLEEQFRAAALALDDMGVALKGDIPILITDDSADVWAERQNFHLDFRAGAPPDALAPGGQNWGFPTYDWKYLRETDFRWWRDRLARAARFYHAYRIDHVLGFFRIWAVPETDVSALSGRFDPAVPVTRAQLEDLGFDEGRITWLSRAHFPGGELRLFGEEFPVVAAMLEQVENEDLWRAAEGAPSERQVAASGLSEETKARLIEGLRNRTLIPVDEDAFLPYLNFRDTRGWHSLSDDEKQGLEELISRSAAESDALWAGIARELLTMMKSDGSMLVCAEDLGAVPACVPGVLDELKILGLKVTRWARLWDLPGQPYEAFRDYPELSVTTSSVHDSSTLRSWLAREAADDTALRQALGLPDDAELGDTAGVTTVLEALQDGNSLLALYPVQDLLALDGDCVTDDPADERVNIPGTVQETNWSWRMTQYVEDLPDLKNLNARIRALSDRRLSRTASFPGVSV